MKMDEEKIDESILELTDILSELASNAIGLSKDLVTGLDAVKQLSYAWFIGAFVMYLFSGFSDLGTKASNQFLQIAVMMVIVGIISFWRFRKLKSKYSQIWKIREKLEFMKG